MSGRVRRAGRRRTEKCPARPWPTTATETLINRINDLVVTTPQKTARTRKPTITFTTLPPEIRLTIYELIFADAKVWQRITPNGRTTKWDLSHSRHQILGVCKSINLDVEQLHAKSMLYAVEVYSNTSLFGFGPRTLAYLEYIQRLHLAKFNDAYYLIRDVDQNRLPSLRELTVGLDPIKTKGSKHVFDNGTQEQRYRMVKKGIWKNYVVQRLEDIIYRQRNFTVSLIMKLTLIDEIVLGTSIVPLLDGSTAEFDNTTTEEIALGWHVISFDTKSVSRYHGHTGEDEVEN